MNLDLDPRCELSRGPTKEYKRVEVKHVPEYFPSDFAHNAELESGRKVCTGRLREGAKKSKEHERRDDLGPRETRENLGLFNSSPRC